jgi:hypothetical protein
MRWNTPKAPEELYLLAARRWARFVEQGANVLMMFSRGMPLIEP